MDTQLPPDRLSVEMHSPHFDPCYTRIGVRLDGLERRGDVHEYSVLGGWITIRQRTSTGQFLRATDGSYVLKKLYGTVVPYWKDGRPTRASAPAYNRPEAATRAALSAAEAKRQRKAERLSKEATRFHSAETGDAL